MTPPGSGHGHVAQLDGWRGISIALVLAAHTLPLGPKALRLNEAAGAAGMALFFTLSGFLITATLLDRPSARDFLIRRGCRIVPLYVVTQAVVLAATASPPDRWAAVLLFTQNYATGYLDRWNSVTWSLCVEVHFYLLAAALVGLLGRRSLYLLPVLGAAVTAARVAIGAPISIHTHLRADEILAGAGLALVVRGGAGGAVRSGLGAAGPWVWLALFAVAVNPHSGPVQYARPYAAALLVGSTLYRPGDWLSRRLLGPVLAELARVSRST